MAITVKQCETRLISEDTVVPVPEVPLFVRSPAHTAASPVIQRHSWAPGGTPRPVASSQQPEGFLQCSELTTSTQIGGTTRRRGAEMKRLSLTIRNQLSSRSVVRPLHPPRLRWCGRPVFRLRRKTLQMHPWDTPNVLALLAESSPQPEIYNSHQYLLLQIRRHYAFKEWQKIQNDLARDTRSIEPSICWADFTQSGSNLSDFISQLNSTLIPIDADEIHSSAILYRWFHNCCRWCIFDWIAVGVTHSWRFWWPIKLIAAKLRHIAI